MKKFFISIIDKVFKFLGFERIKITKKEKRVVLSSSSRGELTINESDLNRILFVMYGENYKDIVRDKLDITLANAKSHELGKNNKEYFSHTSFKTEFKPLRPATLSLPTVIEATTISEATQKETGFFKKKISTIDRIIFGKKKEQ